MAAKARPGCASSAASNSSTAIQPLGTFTHAKQTPVNSNSWLSEGLNQNTKTQPKFFDVCVYIYKVRYTQLVKTREIALS
jgi:hypothetical protein